MISCHYLNKLSKVQAYLHTFKALLKVCRSKHIIKCHTIYINISLNVTYIKKFKNITCILTFFVIILLHISLLFIYLVGIKPIHNGTKVVQKSHSNFAINFIYLKSFYVYPFSYQLFFQIPICCHIVAVRNQLRQQFSINLNLGLIL